MKSVSLKLKWNYGYGRVTETVITAVTVTGITAEITAETLYGRTLHVLHIGARLRMEKKKKEKKRD